MAEFPLMFRLQQTFQRPRVADVEAETRAQLSRLGLEGSIDRGQSVAITAGSRGIANIDRILKAAVAFLQEIGGQPLIIPAMGSHGGGTAAGQTSVLASYGVTEEYCGCPIRASMDTVVVGEAAEGFPIYFDRIASEADHVLVCGRVKPHTGFAGDIQSGLMKMMLIGLGKHDGATIYHRAIKDFSFGQIVRSVADQVLQRCKIVGGLAIVENAYDETALIEGVPPEEFSSREPELLQLSIQWLARLPFPQADVLLVNEIGKNISGTGMDTNLIGRKYNDHVAAADEYPKIKWIIVRGLTEASHGNATGIGLSEFCLSRVVDAMDDEATRINCVTSGHVTAGMIPARYETDREALAAALATVGLTPPQDCRVLWIHNTLEVVELECSAAYLADVQDRDDLDILGPPRPLPFDSRGMLPDQLPEE